MKFVICLKACLWSIFAAIPYVLNAQEPTPMPETRIVLRVSGEFIQCMLGKSFQRDEPIATNVQGVAVTGTAHVTGKLRVALKESDVDSAFDILIDGTVASQITGKSRPVVIQAHGNATFTGKRKYVSIDDQFVAEPVTLSACNQFTLDRICAFHGGLVGKLTERIARPYVLRSLAEGDRYAEEEIGRRMIQALETEFEKVVEAANKIPPLVKQAHQMLILEGRAPSEKVRVYRAATKEHLLFSLGKEGRRIPDLPTLPKEKQGPVELWIAVSKDEQKEKRRAFLLQNWRHIVPFLRAQLQKRSPELTKDVDEPLSRLLDDVQIHVIPGWHVLTFAPKLPL